MPCSQYELNRPLVDPSVWDIFTFPTTTQFPPFYQLPTGMFGKCGNYYRTLGLFGPYNEDPQDDITTPDCNILATTYPQSESDAMAIYYEFGEKCGCRDLASRASS